MRDVRALDNVSFTGASRFQDAWGWAAARVCCCYVSRTAPHSTAQPRAHRLPACRASCPAAQSGSRATAAARRRLTACGTQLVRALLAPAGLLPYCHSTGGGAQLSSGQPPRNHLRPWHLTHNSHALPSPPPTHSTLQPTRWASSTATTSRRAACSPSSSSSPPRRTPARCACSTVRSCQQASLGQRERERERESRGPSRSCQPALCVRWCIRSGGHTASADQAGFCSCHPHALPRAGSPAERLVKPIADYIEAKGGRIHTRWGCRCARGGRGASRGCAWHGCDGLVAWRASEHPPTLPRRCHQPLTPLQRGAVRDRARRAAHQGDRPAHVQGRPGAGHHR